MQAIRIKIFVVIVLLLAAMAVSAMIFMRGGFSLTSTNETPGCGTVSIEPPIVNTNGRELFYSNCASCHAIHKDLTGPALAGFEKRLPLGQLYLFIQQPGKAYKKSKYLVRLKHDYNDIEHLAFPSLAKRDIDDIIQYIEEAEKVYGY